MVMLPPASLWEKVLYKGLLIEHLGHTKAFIKVRVVINEVSD